MQLVDEFRGDDANLIASIEALIEFNDAGQLVPHGIGGHARSLLSAAAVRLALLPTSPDARPIDMVLHCPKCGLQHIDAMHPNVQSWVDQTGEHPDSYPLDDGTWTNPPHRSHLCGGCGTIWRPADVATNGVAAVMTASAADTWKPGDTSPDARREAIEEAARVAQQHLDAVGERTYGLRVSEAIRKLREGR